MSPIRGHSCRPYLVPPPNLASKYEPGGFPQRILCVLLDDTRSTALFCRNQIIIIECWFIKFNLSNSQNRRPNDSQFWLPIPAVFSHLGENVLRMSVEVTRMSENLRWGDDQKKGLVEQIRKGGADEQCTARQTHNWMLPSGLPPPCMPTVHSRPYPFAMPSRLSGHTRHSLPTTLYPWSSAW